MGKIKKLIYFSLLLSAIMFIFTIADFLALHDIYIDYVSTEILDYLNIALDKELPTWTNTDGKWGLVTISFFSRFGLLIVNLIILFLSIRYIKYLKLQ